MVEPEFVAWDTYREYAPAEMHRRAAELLEELSRRRSVRDFSPRAVPREVIECCLRAAGTAPSGAAMQPWHFVVVESDRLKRQIREAAEREEREFYSRRATREWLQALAPLGTGADKPFLETAPCLIAVFARLAGETAEGEVRKHYYPIPSTCIAVGMLIAAVHHAGLACLPYTPLNMGFLSAILGRPRCEKPLMILVVGHPAEGVVVPNLRRKELEEIATFL